MEDRIHLIEGKLDQLIQQLSPPATGPSQAGPSQAVSSYPAPSRASNDSVDESMFSRGGRREENLSNLNLKDASPENFGQLYLTWCHSQPIALFRPDTFLETLHTRELELLLALKALSLRFPPGTLSLQKQEQLDAMAKLSRRRAMDRVTDGHVELSTLQTLCILSIIDFTDGRVVQADLNLSMASHFAQSLQPSSTMSDSEETLDCIRSILMLQRLQGCIFPGARLASVSPMIHNGFPVAGHAKFCKSPEPAVLARTYVDSQMTTGILGHTKLVSEIWQMARKYAAYRVGPDELPPWNSHSDYSCIMQGHMDIDSLVPTKYRFSSDRFGDHNAEELHKRRDYWGAWLFIQLIYAAIPCLLNHPFLLSMRLRNFRHTMPQSFIYQSYELIMRHTGWMIYFIDLMEKKSFVVSDPALAHCVGIVATIHLQHSFVEDLSLRGRAQAGFEKCMKFLRRMGTIWPSIAIMAQNLLKLQASITLAHSPSSRGTEDDPQGDFSIDAQLLWDILIYEQAGRHNAAVDQSMFGESLKGETAHSENDLSLAAANLVGSAGISGHKTVPAKYVVPPYAPSEGGTPPRMTDQRTPAADRVVETRVFEGLGAPRDHDSFLQASDFNKAIENWWDFDYVNQ
ncbi:hypothetical protein G7Z17_g1622 [Cylindrodendrum hubeiense]|uniref:Zn(II)2Cys6 transcription factor n=1 Tax=Cylindrodendrum hubeiense TaxID=595255 RepID=A0A9P5HKH5_9HYPO|nr:hypothetical protein G7Z17_g1622 [Cylindrodendrum hubeiense]